MQPDLLGGFGLQSSTGALTGTFASLTVDGAGISIQPITGSLDETFAAATVTGAGKVKVKGALTSSFAALTVDGEGVEQGGVMDTPFAPLTVTGSGKVKIKGVMTTPFQPLDLEPKELGQDFDIQQPWFMYDDVAAQPIASATVDDTDFDESNSSPVKHVLDRFTYRQWQSPTEDEWFQIDFGLDVFLQALYVVFPRITNPYRRSETQEIESTDRVQHFLDKSGITPGTGGVFNSGLMTCDVAPKFGYHICALTKAVKARYWRCRISASSRSAKGFFLVSLAGAGQIFQPEFPFIYGERLGFPDNSDVQRTPTGQIINLTRNERTLKASLTWDFIRDDERDEWEAMDEHAGNTEPILFALGSQHSQFVNSTTGPNAWILEPRKGFLGLNNSELDLASRQHDANFKQLQLREHR